MILPRIIVILFIFMYGCTYHNEEEYFKSETDGCIPDSISFSQHVYPIIQNNCMGCHNAQDQTGGINLSNYSEIATYAASGLLYGVINHEDGYSAMPKDLSKLDECDINIIKEWIERGLKNN